MEGLRAGSLVGQKGPGKRGLERTLCTCQGLSGLLWQSAQQQSAPQSGGTRISLSPVSLQVSDARPARPLREVIRKPALPSSQLSVSHRLDLIQGKSLPELQLPYPSLGNRMEEEEKKGEPPPFQNSWKNHPTLPLVSQPELSPEARITFI